MELTTQIADLRNSERFREIWKSSKGSQRLVKDYEKFFLQIRKDSEIFAKVWRDSRDLEKFKNSLNASD